MIALSAARLRSLHIVAPKPAVPLLRTVLGELRAAAEAHDDTRARFALGCVLVAAGGTSEGKMTAFKAPRGYGFALASGGDRVTYTIERHPGRRPGNWLMHRTEVRAVDLRTAREYSVRDRAERIGRDDLVRFVEERDQPRKRAKSDFREAAHDAVEYAATLAVQDGDLSGPAAVDIAFGWVARLVRGHKIRKAFRGDAFDVRNALHAWFGAELYAVMREDFGALANEAVEAATSMWTGLPARR